MTSLCKYFFGGLLLALALLLAPPALAQTTATPGWGWVRVLNDRSSSDIDNKNETAGMGRDAAGNLYVAGGFVGTLTVGNLAATTSNSDGFLAKYDPAGALVWVHALRSTGTDATLQLLVLPNGTCILAGYYGRVTGDNLSFADFNSPVALAGPVQVGLSPDGLGKYNGLPFVAAVDAAGTLAWATCPTPTSSIGYQPDYSPAQELAVDSQGNVYLSASAFRPLLLNGTTYPVSGYSDAVLLKLAAGTGQVQWMRQAGAAGATVSGLDVRVDQADNVYWLVSNDKPFTFNGASVGTGSYSTLIKLAGATNQVQWVKGDLLQLGSYKLAGANISGFDSATGVLYLSVASSGQPITYVGASAPVPVATGPGALTYCLARCEPTGQISWVKPLVVNTPTNPNSVVSLRGPQMYPTATGFVLLTSTAAQGTTSFTGSAVTYPASEGDLVCVLHYNLATNQTEWVRTAGTLPYTLSSSRPRYGTYPINAAVDPAGNVYVAGMYYGPAQFGSINLATTRGLYYTFLAKLDQTVLATKAAAVVGRAWQPYPNPAIGTVHLGGLPPRAQVQLLDALGRPVRQTSAADLSLSGLAPGLYLLQVTNTAEPYQSQRLTVE